MRHDRVGEAAERSAGSGVSGFSSQSVVGSSAPLVLANPYEADGPSANSAAPAAGAVQADEEDVARAVDRFTRLLAARNLRLTAARRAIVRAVMHRRGHFPIEELVNELRSQGIRGSRATVYRALPLLTEAGILQQAVITGELRSYEAAVGREHHDHIVCRSCGKVVEFVLEAFEILEREIASRYGFRLEGHFHQLVGRCDACQNAAGDGARRQDVAPKQAVGS